MRISIPSLTIFWIIGNVIGFSQESLDDSKPPASLSEQPEAVDPIEAEYLKLLEADDAAATEIDQWIRDAQKPDATEIESVTLQGRVEQRIKEVRDDYESFIERHPDHADVRLAFASFLSDIGLEDDGVPHLIKATELDPKNPAALNNLANYYGHRGPVKKAFELYAKAIELSPNEAVYYHNFGTTVFLFRKDAKEYYEITEEQVFDKALELYDKALKIDPQNFELANDIAQTYYGIRTPDVPSRLARPNEALEAWDYALKLAPSDLEKEGIYIHLARIKAGLGKFDEARQHLDQVKQAVYDTLKARVAKSVDRQEKKALGILDPDSDGDEIDDQSAPLL